MHTIPRVCVKPYFNCKQKKITVGAVKGRKKGKVGTQCNSDKAQIEPKVQEITELAPKSDC